MSEDKKAKYKMKGGVGDPSKICQYHPVFGKIFQDSLDAKLIKRLKASDKRYGTHFCDGIEGA